MYQPAHHREERLDVQHGLIRGSPLGTLVTFGADGLAADLIPFILDETAGPRGTLRAHVARANPLWRAHDPAVAALVIFQGPQAYVTPSCYETKRETGKVVPTWNYMTVHAYGHMAVVEDRAWLLTQINALTDGMEQGRAEPWSVADAPPDFIETMLEQIIGLEIPIDRIEGKWKLSQNRSRADRDGVIAGLFASADSAHRSLATLMSAKFKTEDQ
ncbi:FMN-binding negative transcriptional regulator [Methylocapsa acidiphila]|uniref:FMN-binding negative transcriptional regulator n=1 Tax=Methylocapsa acidiphila TaxID=133552 RepID=UPI0004203D05|nr:FMN-binding negative transcriptional regulator [Methylocapsa acidiphila]